MKKKILFILFAIFFVTVAYAETAFVVKNIQIQGLQGVSRQTVMSYLPVKVGDRVDVAKSSEIIKSLFKTGFFDNVRLARKNGTLIIRVTQRPVIGDINITGNKQIPTDKLTQALRKLGFYEGAVFNSSVLAKIKSSLKSEYFIVGKYNARVNVSVTKEKRNRVGIAISISEGKVAKIHAIKIIGNHAFKEKELLSQFRLSTTGLLSFYTHNNQYSAEKLSADLETLRSYYMDRGYIKFKVDSSQVSITPNRKQVYITIRITEGSQYKISGYSISGDLILPKSQLGKLIKIKKGDIFSRKILMDSDKRIAQALGEKGYAHADISAIPKINEKDKTVFLMFKIKPGPRIYVHRITFSNNNRTNDEAYRRELLQLEGGLLSPKSVEESKRRLLLLPYVKNVQVSTTPVAGESSQVDVNYKMHETMSASLQGGIAYSQLEKFMITGAVKQENLFGTGNRLGINLSYSRSAANASFSYFNPYYTESHIGRGIDLTASRFDADKVNITNYATDTYSFAMRYYFPLAENDNLQLGYGLENNQLKLGSSPSRQLEDFRADHGRHFYQIKLSSGWSHQGFDRYLFPTSGLSSSVDVWATVPISNNKSLEYYKFNARGTYYHPVYKSFVGQLRGNIGYGNGYGSYSGNLPFFKNFYSGGLGSVRGYEGNTLGPKDSNGDALGGNFEIDGTVGLVFPNPISNDIRTVLFVDGGNAYNGVKLTDLRFSTGLEVDWKSPVGVLNFSLATPLNARSGDETTPFQFTMGTTF
jgi:outer membrane protein insertion porin family